MKSAHNTLVNCLAICAAAGLATSGFTAGAKGQTVRVGAGSYAVEPPPGTRQPPRTIYQTERFRGKVPTNDWWSSLAWMPYSERQYPHPLAVCAVPAGLQVYYPGPHVTAGERAIFGSMPGPAGGDVVLGHSAVAEFPDARLDGCSDWFVRAAFGRDGERMLVSYGHGSPWVFALFEGGGARLEFPRPPRVWAGTKQSPVLGISIGGTHYGLFGPGGSRWDGLGTAVLVCHPADKAYFSLALLPDDSAETLSLFRRHAYAHVTDTQVAWRYDPSTSSVRTTFQFTTTAYEGDERRTLFALYPHQWTNTFSPRLPYTYQSVRGTMQLACGTSFSTEMTFPGVLPALPDVGACDKQVLARHVADEIRQGPPPTKDTYWEGKHLGKLATLLPLAEQAGDPTMAKAIEGRLKHRLEGWFTATDQSGKPKPAGLFYYDDAWGTLIGYPAAYGSDVELNDHHFHYGYFIKAAAELARRDPAWAGTAQWGGMVRLLIDDVAADRDNPRFPFLRNFDPYAGHSWASGAAKFADGNNQESSSEAMNAWCAMILYGEATGDSALRDLGIYLFTTELHAINAYWFDVPGTNHPPNYAPPLVTMIWGGKGANETWFSAEPEAIHGINWLPIHGGSLYLGLYPEYAAVNYNALVRANGGTAWSQWADLIWMYRALSDADDARRQFEARPAGFRCEPGNSTAATYHWIQTLAALGRVERSVTADYPLFAVFRGGGRRTYVVYNMDGRPRSVRFSDGATVAAGRKGFTIVRR